MAAKPPYALRTRFAPCGATVRFMRLSLRDTPRKKMVGFGQWEMKWALSLEL